jgi:nicotinate-nucleotide adenylyltransferase
VNATVLLPAHARGMKIGLLGGSFNPTHEGHRAMSLMALKRLRLDRIWWLVTPGNPLKDPHALVPTAERVAQAVKIAAHPRIHVTAFEAAIGTHYTVDTLQWLQTHASGVRFVWIMGADNLLSFHHWRHWRRIAGIIPIAVIDRPAARGAAASPLAYLLQPYRLPERLAPRLPLMRPPAFVFLRGLKSPASSTALRASRSPPRAGIDAGRGSPKT